MLPARVLLLAPPTHTRPGQPLVLSGLSMPLSESRGFLCQSGPPPFVVGGVVSRGRGLRQLLPWSAQGPGLPPFRGRPF